MNPLHISWIDEEWRLHTDFAFFIPLRERHTGVNLAHHLVSWVLSRDVGKQIISIATDNASNNITMLERFAETEGIEFNPRHHHVRCACHSIGRVVYAFMKALGCQIPSLAVRPASVPDIFLNDQAMEELESQDQGEDLENSSHNVNDVDIDEEQECESDGEQPIMPDHSLHGTSAAMARKFCRVTMRSSHLVAKFKEKSHGGKALKRVAGIRWANDVEVWESVLEHQHAIVLMIYDHPSFYAEKNIKLSSSDFKNLERLKAILGPLRDATRQMEENGPTGSTVFDMWLGLLKHLERAQEEYASEADLVDAIDAARNKAQSYVEQGVRSWPLLIATALHPMGRLHFFRKHTSLGVPPTFVHQLLLDVCEQIAAEAISNSAQLPPRPKQTQFSFLSYDDGCEVGKTPNRSTIEYEIDRFNNLQNVPQEHVTISHDPLQWWKMNAHLFPTVAKAARQYLSVLGSQAVTERLFSASAAVCNPRRMGNFRPETISAQVGADQLLRNGYCGTGTWAEAQRIIDKRST